MQKIKAKEIIFVGEKKKFIFDLFEANLLKNNERIVEILINFFKAHGIEYKISESLCDELSKNDFPGLQRLLNLAYKLDIDVESNQSSLKKYPEASRKVWKAYYSLLLDD